MKIIIKQIAFDVFLYALMYLTIVKSVVWADNLLSFIVVSMGVIAVASMLCGDEAINKVADAIHEKEINLTFRYWCRVSTLVELAIFASQGWYIMSTLWLCAILHHFNIHKKYDEKFGKPPLI